MAAIHGKTTHIELDSGAGTLVDLSEWADDISFPQELSADEVTGFKSTDKKFVTGLGEAKISMGGKLDTSLDAHMGPLIAALKAGTLASASFAYGPGGNANGKLKYSGEAILTNYEVSQKVSDVGEWKAELQITGAVTRGTFSG